MVCANLIYILPHSTHQINKNGHAIGIIIAGGHEFMDILANFAERLKEIMQDNNIKSEKLGEATGINGSTIRRYLRTGSVVNLSKLLILTDYFKCSIEFLIGRSDDYLPYTPKPCPQFSIRLRTVLKERGLNRYKLDKNTRFKDSYFDNWDHGADPNIETLAELADMLGCTIDYLIGRDQ